MKSIVLLLALCSVVMFALVLRTVPGKLPSIGLWEKEEKKANEKPVEKSTARRSVANVTAPVKSSSDRESTPTRPSSAPASSQRSNQAAASVRIPSSEREVISAKKLTISRDSATLYAVNSEEGTVLTVLSKGTVVEPNLQLLNPADNWTLVRVPDLNIFGFVQTANLIRTDPPQPIAR